MISLLNRVFAREFYRMNIGFFLLAGTFAFGFMSKIEHIALAEAFVSTPFLLLVPIATWLLYTIKIVNFNFQQLGRSENQILFNTAFISFRRQFQAAAFFLTLQLLPAIAYGLFLIIIAGLAEIYFSALIVGIVLISILSGITAIMVSTLQHPYREKKITFVKRFMDYRYAKPIVQFYLEWLFRRDPLMLVGSKLFAALLVLGVCALYHAEKYDGRLIAMAMTVAAMVSLPIVFHLQNFENCHMMWVRNLPVRLSRRFFWFLSVLAILFIPEAVVLTRNFPPHLSFYDLMINILYALSLGACFFGLLHRRHYSLEKLAKICFAIFITMVLLILFKVPLTLITVLNFTIGLWLYNKYYYLYELFREPATE